MVGWTVSRRKEFVDAVDFWPQREKQHLEASWYGRELLCETDIGCDPSTSYRSRRPPEVPVVGMGSVECARQVIGDRCGLVQMWTEDLREESTDGWLGKRWKRVESEGGSEASTGGQNPVVLLSWQPLSWHTDVGSATETHR